MDELLFSMKLKYKDLDITRRHLGRVIIANNRTRKRTRHQHYPKERRNQLTYKNKEIKFINIHSIRLFVLTKQVLALI
jgi:hypothetical protein